MLPRCPGRLALSALAVLTVGCGGRYGGTPRTAAASGTASPATPVDLEAAALPYQIVDARTGRQVEAPAFWTALARARAVCVGEDHTSAHHHWVQLEVVRQLAKRAGGTPFALGLEMVQRPFQGPLDDYAASKIDAATLRSRTDWAERWGYDWGFYGPTLDAAAGAGGALLALNAPRELTKKVVREGLEALTPSERAQLPQLVLDDATHRAWFDALMAGMGGAHGHSSAKAPEAKAPEAKAADAADAADTANPHHGVAAMPSAERIYTVQVIWDESMADGTATWLAAHPQGKAIILAGNGHCHESAIVRRLERRGVGDVVSVRPVLDIGSEVADVLAKPVNDFAVVLQLSPEARAAAEKAAAEE